MSIQRTFNQQAISMLPKIKSAIESAPDFESNQMQNRALREILNSEIPLDNMSKSQLSAFSDDLLSSFKYLEWIDYE